MDKQEGLKVGDIVMLQGNSMWVGFTTYTKHKIVKDTPKFLKLDNNMYFNKDTLGLRGDVRRKVRPFCHKTWGDYLHNSKIYKAKQLIRNNHHDQDIIDSIPEELLLKYIDLHREVIRAGKDANQRRLDDG